MIWIVAERVVLVQRPLTGAGRFNEYTHETASDAATVQRPLTGAGRFNEWKKAAKSPSGK